MRGLLLTGLGPSYLRSDISGRAGDTSEAATEALWWPPAKIAGRHLGPYLARRATPLDGETLADRQPLAGSSSLAATAEHQAARDLALALADAEGGWGHYKEALEALDAAEYVDGVLSPEYAAKRSAWSRAFRGRT